MKKNQILSKYFAGFWLLAIFLAAGWFVAGWRSENAGDEQVALTLPAAAAVSQTKTPWRDGKPARPSEVAPPVVSRSPKLELREPLLVGGDYEMPPNFPWFKTRPFAVASETAAYQWTAEDGRDPAVIKQLAHQEHEEERYLDENTYVARRQLVYSKNPLSEIGRKIAATGELTETLTLPDFDGRELVVNVDQASVANNGMDGSFTGHLAGDPDAFVTLSFHNGYESFRVIRFGSSRIFGGDAREPGQLVLRDEDMMLRPPPGEDIETRLFDVGEPLPPRNATTAVR